MKFFASAMLASAVSARGASGGINQGYANKSLGASHGYGYNIGNGYGIGDSHGQYMAHQNGRTGGKYPNPSTGASFDAMDAHDHVFGYDSVQPFDDSDWDTAQATTQTTIKDAITGAIATAQADRESYIEEVLQRRKDRLSDIHEDNLLKIEAPFDLQLDLLEEERSDIEAAQAHALTDAQEAYDDLLDRMQDYQDDREEALFRELDRVIRALERAVDDSKPVDEVLYAMRLDWLQGVYVSGSTAYYDDEIYDLSVFDTEFDMFTFDIGHGKGHGHRTGTHGPGNDREQGFVVGSGGSGDISQLNAEPVPIGGKRGRYDRATQSGNGAANRPSNYELGLKAGDKEGAYRYNQAADLGVQQRKRRAPKRRPAPKRAAPAYEKPAEPAYEEPKAEPAYEEPAKPVYKKPAMKRPSYKRQSYRPTKKTTYRKPV